MGKTQTIEHEETTTGTYAHFYAKVILFNCDCHSFQQVALQLMKAIHCSYSQGMGFASTVHTKGSAVVYNGLREHCEAVADVLGEIGLRTIVD